ncbi:MAG: NAD(P)/FAD-dependent oxidoreductase, partial [Firmicutes bacterium]|nr:NAD(P)/FAD-dependent oxidoreductase [Bacillota bacterium]
MGTVLKSVVVVGGGAAGLAAAWRAASLGHSVTLLEANGRLGVKLRISGGGKCNVTHEGAPKALLAAFPTDQARFLRPAFHGFTSEDLRELLRQRGVETYVRENGRVFPLDLPGSAAAVVAAWEGLVREAGVVVRSQARAMDLVGDAPRVEAVVLESGQWVRGEQFILAVGGASYPETGTRGEWLGRLEKRGVAVRPWRPALAPIPLERPRPQWSGVALREGAMHLWEGRGGRRLGRFPGDLLFTSAGLSGPAALEGSEATETARRQGAAWLTYAFTELDEASLDGELQRFQGAHPHTAARTWLQRWMPERVAAAMVEEASLAADQRMKD